MTVRWATSFQVCVSGKKHPGRGWLLEAAGPDRRRFFAGAVETVRNGASWAEPHRGRSNNSAVMQTWDQPDRSQLNRSNRIALESTVIQCGDQSFVSGTAFAFPSYDQAGCEQRLHPARRKKGAAKSAPGEPTMYHTIEFADDLIVDLEISPKHWLERMVVRKGTRLQAQIKPYVVETDDGPVEVADLFFEDGTTTRMVRCESFSFAE
jgi:hypothetical protein